MKPFETLTNAGQLHRLRRMAENSLTAYDVRVLAIDGETFKEILRERPDVSFAVLRSVSRRLREMRG
jgi:CRP-like cAMP-binding protein